MRVSNALAYYDTESIEDVIGFITPPLSRISNSSFKKKRFFNFKKFQSNVFETFPLQSLKCCIEIDQPITWIFSYHGRLVEWRRISCKQSARWQHLSRLKVSTFFSLQQKNLVVKKYYNLYLRLVMPSGG